MLARNPLKKVLGLSLVLALLGAGPMLAETFQIDASHSQVGFKIRHIFSQVPGQFNEFTGTVQYDAAHPEATKIDATIQAASVNTQNERRDGHLKSADFFDVEKYPTLTFKSKSAKKAGENLIHVTGDLTLHGVTKEITLPVEVLGSGPHPMREGATVAGFSAETTVKRSDFGVNNWTDAANVLGDEVKVTLEIEAVAMPASE